MRAELHCICTHCKRGSHLLVSATARSAYAMRLQCAFCFSARVGSKCSKNMASFVCHCGSICTQKLFRMSKTQWNFKAEIVQISVKVEEISRIKQNRYFGLHRSDRPRVLNLLRVSNILNKFWHKSKPIRWIFCFLAIFCKIAARRLPVVRLRLQRHVGLAARRMAVKFWPIYKQKFSGESRVGGAVA